MKGLVRILIKDSPEVGIGNKGEDFPGQVLLGDVGVPDLRCSLKGFILENAEEDKEP